MSGWDPHRDLARLIEALGRELVASGEPEVRAACFDDGDSIHTAARDLRVLVGMLVDEANELARDARLIEMGDGRAQPARQH
jgi:hypothetical protein